MQGQNDQVPAGDFVASRPFYPELTLRIGETRFGPSQRNTMDVVDPSTGSSLGPLPIATAADLDHALAAAVQGFGTWRRVPARERASILHRAADVLRARRDAIAVQLTLEEGKPLLESQREIEVAADMLDWSAEEARRTGGRSIPSRGDGIRFHVEREPVGPVAAFSPWNFPATQPMRKIAAALAVGCSCILKPAEETPATALALADALDEAGLPPGVLSVVFGDPAAISRHLIGSEAIRKVSFTGSTAVGRLIAGLAAQRVKRCTLELGGHAPALVLEDAQIDSAVERLASAKFRNSGQACISPSRIMVHSSHFKAFIESFVSRAAALPVGAGLNPASKMGPLANPRRLSAMQSLVDDAISCGARLLTGGEQIGEKGYFWQPTVLCDVPMRARIMNDEPFGPVAIINSFDSLDDALREANRLPYGLAAFAFTASSQTVARLAAEVECGMIAFNSCAVTLPETPFGGVKDSGYGSEGGSEGLDAYLVTKLVSQAS